MSALFGGGNGKRDAAIAAEKQTQANAQNVRDQAANAAKYGNRTDQFGNTTGYTQNPDGTYTSTSSLGGVGQEFLNGTAALGGQSRDALGNLISRSIDPNAIAADADKYYASATANTSRMQEQQRAALDSRLRNQGVVPGTEAYDKAMRGWQNSADDANMRQYDISQRTAHDTALADLSNSQNFALGVNGQVNPILSGTLRTDMTGMPNILTPAAVNEGGLYMQGAQQDQAAKNAMWGAIGGLGGAALGGLGGVGGLTGGLSRIGSMAGMGGGVGGDLPWTPTSNPRWQY